MWMYGNTVKHHTTFDVIDQSKTFEENFWEFLACDMSERGEILLLICFSGRSHFADNIQLRLWWEIIKFCGVFLIALSPSREAAVKD